jgi:excisionase family DNA binding protein
MGSTPKLGTGPTLADLLNDPLKINGLPREAIPYLRGELVQLDTLLLCRLLEDKNQSDGVVEGDQLLNIAEASSRLGISPDYLYRHHKGLPFTRRVGRKLLFSTKGIEKYISQKPRT